MRVGILGGYHIICLKSHSTMQNICNGRFMFHMTVLINHPYKTRNVYRATVRSLENVTVGNFLV